MSIKLIVAGGRDFLDRDRFNSAMRSFECDNEGLPDAILSGMARGADQMGVDYAMENNIQILPFPALWHRHGRSAGPIRNRQMARNATHLLAFWDGRSRGTRDMIQVAEDMKLNVRIARY